MGDIVRADANGRENIWLRQSVTFTVDGQTRTLEVGIPLPSGATPDDVEALLNEADAGMVRLSQYLDERVAAQLGMPLPPAAPVIVPRQTVTEQPPAPIIEDPVLEPADETPELPAAVAPTIEAPVAAPTAAPAPAPTREPHEVAPVAPAAPVQPTPARSAPRAASPTPAPAQPASTSGPRNPQPTAPVVTGPDMTRPQFIGALGELGLNPKQAMDRLSVRTLEGLNLREALEALRRQLVQETSGSAAPEPAVESSTHESAPVPAAAPRYFDEEDDPNLVFTVDAPDFEDEEDEFDAVATTPKTLDDEDDLDLDDVPDFPAPLVTASRTARKPAPARTPEAEPATSGPLQSSSSPDRTRAMQLIGKLRSAQGGGPASDYQRKAYHNLVEGQLDEGQAAALVRGLWRIPAERLTSDQFDALIRWGKEDDFVDEAALVIATLRAEQVRAASANGAADTQEPANPPQRSRPVRGTGASSARQGSAR